MGRNGGDQRALRRGGRRIDRVLCLLEPVLEAEGPLPAALEGLRAAHEAGDEAFFKDSLRQLRWGFRKFRGLMEELEMGLAGDGRAKSEA